MIARTILAPSFVALLALPGLGLAGSAEPAGKVIVVRVAELHLGDGRVHSPGALLIEGGRIKALGASVEAPEGAAIWNEPTGVLTPWLVDASVRVPLAPGEGGKLEAALLSAADARPLWDPALPALREGGLLAMELVPDGGTEILGRSAVVGTLGPGPAGAPVLVRDAHLALAAASASGSTAAAAARQTLADVLDATERYSKKRAEWAKESKDSKDKEGAVADAAASSRDDFGHRSAAAKDEDEPELDPAREIVARVNEKKLPLRIRVDRATDVSALLALAKKRGLSMVLVGCRECAAIAEEVGDSQASVVLEPARESAAELAGLEFDPNLAASLAEAGARLAVSAGGEWPAGPSWLRVMAADLAGSGVPRAQAIAAMSGEAARAAGLPDAILAAGIPARFLVWDRDPLEPSAKPIRRVVPEDVGFGAKAPKTDDKSEGKTEDKAQEKNEDAPESKPASKARRGLGR